jgi:hypothetical protein
MSKTYTVFFRGERLALQAKTPMHCLTTLANSLGFKTVSELIKAEDVYISG